MGFMLSDIVLQGCYAALLARAYHYYNALLAIGLTVGFFEVRTVCSVCRKLEKAMLQLKTPLLYSWSVFIKCKKNKVNDTHNILRIEWCSFQVLNAHIKRINTNK